MTVPLNKNALHQIYNIIVGTIDAMEYLVYYFGLLTLKSNFFFVLARNNVTSYLPGRESICLVLAPVFLYFRTLFFSILLLPTDSSRFLFTPSFLILSLQDVFRILRRQLKWNTSGTFVIFLGTFHVSYACKAV